MAKIIIRKSYPIENGDLSIMAFIKAENVTKAVEHELIDLRGIEAEVKAVSEESEPDTALAEIQRKADAYDRISEIVSRQYAEEIGVDKDPELEPAPLLKTDTGEFEYGEEAE